MASTRERFTKDGQRYFEIRVRRGRDSSPLSKNWYPPKGWSEKVVQRELTKEAAEFERLVKAGEIVSRTERKEKEREEAAVKAAELAKVRTVEQFSETFMKKVALEKSENTRQNYECLLSRHIIPAIGCLPVQEVTCAEIDQLMTNMLEKGYKLSTRQRTWTVLNLLFKAAKHQRLIRYSPMDELDGERPEATKAEKAALDARREAYFTADEVRRLFDLVDAEPLKWRCYFYLVALCGIRRGEGLALKWSDIDFKNRTIRIAKSLNYTADAGVYVSETKTGKTTIKHFVADDPETKETFDRFFGMLQELKDSQRDEEKIVDMKRKREGWVFRQDGTDKPMHPTSPTTYFRRFGEKHGFANFHPHLLRHAFVSIGFAEHQNPIAISRAVGHSDLKTTMNIYAHSNADDVAQVISAVGKAISHAQAAEPEAASQD